MLPILFVIALFLQSCTTSTKVGYVNLNEVYPKLGQLVKADSVYKVQQQQMAAYATFVNKQLKVKKIPTKELQNLTTKYNDTLTAFKKQVEQAYATVLATENNNIQKAIDSVSVLHAYEFVFSTKNNSILYVKDTTHNLTPQILKLLLKK